MNDNDNIYMSEEAKNTDPEPAGTDVLQASEESLPEAAGPEESQAAAENIRQASTQESFTSAVQNSQQAVTPEVSKEAAGNIPPAQYVIPPQVNPQDPYNKYIYVQPGSNGFVPYQGYVYPQGYPIRQNTGYVYPPIDYSRPIGSNEPDGHEGVDIKKANKKNGKSHGFLKGAAMSAVFGLVAAAFFLGIVLLADLKFDFLPKSGRSSDTNSTFQISATKSNTKLNLDSETETEKIPETNVIASGTFSGTDVSAVVEKAMPSIVSITCSKQVNYYYYGTYNSSTLASGIIISKNDQEFMIATNEHVVDNAKEITITFCDGTSAKATVKGSDQVVDIAVVAVQIKDLSNDTLSKITTAKLGSSDDLKIGEMAIAIGNSLGYGQSVTVGYISAKGRTVTLDGQTYYDLLQTDAAINPGNSGGALMNIAGEVIGINNGKTGGTIVEGIGYAIPISKAQDILDDFASRETVDENNRGYLGVTAGTVTEDNDLEWPVGAYITNIKPDGAAEKAGLLVGDIVTAVDGLQIKDASALTEKIMNTKSGTEVTLTVQRQENGEFKELQIKVTLDTRPVDLS